MPIPKVIHQMWVSDEDPDCKQGPNGKGLNSRISFGLNSPDFDYVFWNLRDVYNLFEKPYFSPFLEQLKPLKSIQKSDIARIMIIYEYGGFYLDLKYINVKSLNTLADHEMILFSDVLKRVSGFNIFNGAFASFPRNPIMLGLLHYIMKNLDAKRCTYEATGPAAWGSYFELTKILPHTTPQYYFDSGIIDLRFPKWEVFRSKTPYMYVEEESRTGWFYQEKNVCVRTVVREISLGLVLLMIIVVITLFALKALQALKGPPTTL